MIMPNKNQDAQLRALVDQFVEDISSLVRESALEAVEEVLGQAQGRAARAPRPAGKPKAASRSKARRAKGGRRIRRSPEQMEEIGNAVLKYVKANPGQRLEEIGVGMETDTHDLKRPIFLLIEAGALKTTGQKRGTKYFIGSSKKKKG